MYKYVETDTEYFRGLEELGKEMVVEILLMIPENYEMYTAEIARALQTYDYSTLQRAVHSIKSDFRYVISVKDPVIAFFQDFENRASDMKEAARNDAAENHHDFSPDFIKLKEMAAPVLAEIIRFTEDYRQSI